MGRACGRKNAIPRRTGINPNGIAGTRPAIWAAVVIADEG
jgi:hypothetical protein